MIKQLVPWAIALVLAIIALGRCGHVVPPVPAKLHDDLVRYEQQHVSDSVLISSLRTQVAANEQSARQHASSAATHASAAAQHTISADSAAHLASIATSARDSAGHWHDAFLSERKTSDELRAANADLQTSFSEQQAASVKLKTIADSSQAEVKSVRALNVRLQKAADDANKCRVFWKIPCPTRTATAVITSATSFALGAVAGASVSRAASP